MNTDAIARGIAKLNAMGIHDNDKIFGNQATHIAQWAATHGIGVYDVHLMYSQYHARRGFSCECGCQAT